MYNYWTNNGYHPIRGVPYNPNRFKFIDQTTSEAIKIDYVYQEAASEGWKQFIPVKSNGFTRSGAVRIDDSIRNYVHCILGSQAQTRSSILKSFETQQYFVDLLEQNIKSMLSIPESIDKYQDAITKTNSRIDYVIAIGLYMIPSDLVLKVGTLIGYNNNIVVATPQMKIGQNEQVNAILVQAIDNKLPKSVQVESLEAPESDEISPIYVSISISILIWLVYYVMTL
jgi:hypothetical protein